MLKGEQLVTYVTVNYMNSTVMSIEMKMRKINRAEVSATTSTNILQILPEIRLLYLNWAVEEIFFLKNNQ